MDSAAEAKPAPMAAGAGKVDPRRWWALIVLMLAGFMNLLDVSIVNVAIPSIRRDLGATYAAIQWVIAAYSLAFALMLITGGRLGDIFGRKRMFLVGVVGFTVASLLCGLARSPEWLIGARLFQGAMAATMVPQVLSIVQTSFPPNERAKVFGIYGAVIGISTISGPLAGGLLIDAHLFGLDWRPIFLVNIPIGLIAFIGAAILVHESKAPHTLRLDPIGVTVLTLGLAMLFLPLVEGRELDWPAWTFAAMAASLPVFAVFVLFERYKTKKDGSPLVVLELFGESSFVAGLLVSVTFSSALGSFFLIFTIFMQIGLEFTALHAALTTLPFSVGAAIASSLSAKLVPRFGRDVMVAGGLAMAAGMAGLAFVLEFVGTDFQSLEVLPVLLLIGLGMGLVMAPLMNAVLAGVPRQFAGSASGILHTAQQLGIATGVAGIGMIFFGLLESRAGASADAAGGRLRAELREAAIVAPPADAVLRDFRQCVVDRFVAVESALPPSCLRLVAPAELATLPVAQGERFRAIVGEALTEARQLNFHGALLRGLAYPVGIYVLSSLLMLRLPRRIGR